MSEDEFKKEMASKPAFTLVDYKQRIVDGLNKLKKGLKAKFMTGNEQTEANLTSQKKLLNALYDEELVDYKLITSDQKKEIAMLCQCEVSDVNMLIKNYKNLLAVHKWIRNLKEKGEELPKNQDEMMQRFRKEQQFGREIVQKEMKRMRNSKRQYTKRIKWSMKKKL